MLMGPYAWHERLIADVGAEEEVTMHRQLRLLVGVFTGLLWIDNLTEHYRGASKVIDRMGMRRKQHTIRPTVMTSFLPQQYMHDLHFTAQGEARGS